MSSTRMTKDFQRVGWIQYVAVTLFVFRMSEANSASGVDFDRSGSERSPFDALEPSKCTEDVSWSDENCFLGPVSIDKDVAPDVFNQLCPAQRGKKEAPTSCDFYIVCYDGDLTVNRCPPGNNFHTQKKTCVDSHMFECSHPAIENPRKLLEKKRKPNNAKVRRQLRRPYAEYGNPRDLNVGPSFRFDSCRNGEEGIFEHPGSCQHFIQCASGRLFVQKCPDGTTFNPILSICDWKKAGGCVYRAKRALVSELKQTMNPDLSSRALEEHFHFVQKRSPCSTDYVTPHPKFCNKFQICSNGKLYTQACVNGTLFDPLRSVCAHSREVDCTSRILDFGTYDCPIGEKYRTTHPDDCRKFVECENEKIHIKTCPANTIFNPEIEKCDHSYKTPCKSVISLEHDIDINYLPQTLNRQQRDLSKYVCESNYIAPLEGSCNQFLECEDKRLFKKSCGPGTAYNPLLGVCDWPHNVRLPDPEFCRKYLQCDGRKFIPKGCHGSRYFNPATAKCDVSSNVDCAGKRDDPRRNPGGFQSK